MKKSLVQEEQELAEVIKKTREVYVDSMKTSKRLWHRFVDGIASGFGIAIGGTVVFGLALYIATRIILPILPQWISDNFTSASDVNNR